MEGSRVIANATNAVTLCLLPFIFALYQYVSRVAFHYWPSKKAMISATEVGSLIATCEIGMILLGQLLPK